MTYRRIMQELLQRCNDYIDRVHEQYCEIFNRKFQKYEDQLVEVYQTTNTTEDEYKLNKYRHARDKHYDKIKQQLINNIGGIFFNEYLRKPESQELMIRASETLLERQVELVQQTKATKAIQDNYEHVQEIRKMLIELENDVENGKINLNVDNQQLTKQFQRLPVKVFKDIANNLNSFKIEP